MPVAGEAVVGDGRISSRRGRERPKRVIAGGAVSHESTVELAQRGYVTEMVGLPPTNVF